MAVNYYNRYVELFDFDKRVQKQFVKMNPRNFYRISRYEYSDGETKNLTGRESALVFVIGTFDDKINCIKLNEVLPDVFLKFIKTVIERDLTEGDVDSMKMFSDLIKPTSVDGNSLFEGKIKGKPIYNLTPRPYRTYNLDGLKYIQQINLKKDLIKTML
jgi:hypothetical protein